MALRLKNSTKLKSDCTQQLSMQLIKLNKKLNKIIFLIAKQKHIFNSSFFLIVVLSGLFSNIYYTFYKLSISLFLRERRKANVE
jgi:hypothetical protein